MQKNKKNPLEEKLLNSNISFDYENEFKNQIEKEIEDARKFREKKKSKDNYLIETDFSKLSKEERFDRNTIYRVFNRIQKTETFVNGEQAENLIKYVNDYVVRFDHRIIEC
jgi:hypothetical protein